MALEFEWSPDKAIANRRKHGVPFEEAASVFRDEFGATFPDPDHSNDEERAITVGVSNLGRLVFVSHTDRNDLIRIISARELTRHERRQYEESRS